MKVTIQLLTWGSVERESCGSWPPTPPHPALACAQVNYAGLASHEGAGLHASQATHGGALLSFETGDVEVSKARMPETKFH
jgi:hypothetical protein